MPSTAPLGGHGVLTSVSPAAAGSIENSSFESTTILSRDCFQQRPTSNRRHEVADTFSKKRRSEIMSAIRGKDTKPELVVRKILYAMGFRYRLHVRALPGTPEIVLSSTRKIINVHGCFWHLHRCRRGRS